MYLGVYGQRLRFLEAGGQLVPTSDEAAIAAEQNAAVAEQRATHLANKLRELGVDPDTI